MEALKIYGLLANFLDGKASISPTRFHLISRLSLLSGQRGARRYGRRLPKRRPSSERACLAPQMLCTYVARPKLLFPARFYLALAILLRASLCSKSVVPQK